MINISKKAYQVPREEGRIQVQFVIEVCIQFQSSVQLGYLRTKWKKHMK
jgi:hypothetical protein